MNKAIIVGRLTKDIELQDTKNGTLCTRFTLAVPRKGKKEETDFLPCIAFGKTAELLGNLAKKGSRIGVEGHWQSGSYEKDGHAKYTLDCIVDSMEVYFDKKEAEGVNNVPTETNTNSNENNYPF